MKNTRTGELRTWAEAGSWFLLSPFIGIPLFLRGLYLLDALMIVINIASLSLLKAAAEAQSDFLLFSGFAIQLGYLIYLGIKGNERTAKSLLDKGWVFAKPDSLEAQYPASRWGIALPEIPVAQSATGA